MLRMGIANGLYKRWNEDASTTQRFDEAGNPF
jgi:hypothetical protein